jgi:hypothetical protein
MRRNPAKALEVLTGMLEYFDGGKRWCRGELEDQGGQSRCLIGALRHITKEQSIRAAGTDYYLYASLLIRRGVDSRFITSMLSKTDNPFYPGERHLMDYNNYSDDYDDVRELIVVARAWAQAEIDRQRDRQRGSAQSKRDSALVQIESEEMR